MVGVYSKGIRDFKGTAERLTIRLCVAVGCGIGKIFAKVRIAAWVLRSEDNQPQMWRTRIQRCQTLLRHHAIEDAVWLMFIL